jgi:FKBP-type peptidyl-prolyl cis-trans isomerase FkpA
MMSRTLAVASLLLALSPAVHAKPGVETLPSGVTVQRLTTTQGAMPAASDTVTVHYRGTLANGFEFDSSYARGVPASFPLGQVIPCWTQGVQKMRVGEKATLVCPSQTAYGAREIPGKIPANSTLTFEVELLGIVK